MDLLGVVSVDLVVLLVRERSQGSLDVGIGILGANHETNLTRGVGGDGSVSVLNNGEDLLAGLLEVRDDLEMEPNALALSGDDTLLSEGLVKKHKVGLLEERLGGTLGVRRVSDDDIKGVLVLSKELETIANVDSDTGVVESSSHLREELLGNTGHSLVNVTKNSLLDASVLDDLTENTTITTANDKDLLGIRVRVKSKMSNHLLVSELVTLGGLNSTIQNKNVTVISTLKDKDLEGEKIVNIVGLWLVGSQIRCLSHLRPGTWIAQRGEFSSL